MYDFMYTNIYRLPIFLFHFFVKIFYFPPFFVCLVHNLLKEIKCGGVYLIWVFGHGSFLLLFLGAFVGVLCGGVCR